MFKLRSIETDYGWPHESVLSNNCCQTFAVGIHSLFRHWRFAFKGTQISDAGNDVRIVIFVLK